MRILVANVYLVANIAKSPPISRFRNNIGNVLCFCIVILCVMVYLSTPLPYLISFRYSHKIDAFVFLYWTPLFSNSGPKIFFIADGIVITFSKIVLKDNYLAYALLMADFPDSLLFFDFQLAHVLFYLY